MKHKGFLIYWSDDNMPDEDDTSNPDSGGGDGDKKQYLTEEMPSLQLRKHSEGISSINTILKG